MKKLITPWLATAAVALGATLAALAPAQAAIISTEWDPVFGPPLTNLGWKGSMTFDTDTGLIQELNVSFYDARDPLQTDISSGTRLFTAASVAGVIVTPLSFTPDGKVASFQSNRTDWQLALTSVMPSLTNDWLFSLQFEIDSKTGLTVANLFAKQPTESDANEFSSADKGIVYCVPGNAVFANGACGLGTRDGTDVGAVPEPGSLALVFAAMMGAGLVARRRQSQPAA